MEVAAGLVGTAWRRAAATGEHVRNHGDDSACDAARGASARVGGSEYRESDRQGVGRPATLFIRRADGVAAGGRVGRAICGWRGPGARVLEASGVDGAKVRAQPVRE